MECHTLDTITFEFKLCEHVDIFFFGLLLIIFFFNFFEGGEYKRTFKFFDKESESDACLVEQKIGKSLLCLFFSEKGWLFFFWFKRKVKLRDKGCQRSRRSPCATFKFKTSGDDKVFVLFPVCF